MDNTWLDQIFSHRQTDKLTCTSITWLRPVLHTGTLLCMDNTWLDLVFSHRQTSKPVQATPGSDQLCKHGNFSLSEWYLAGPGILKQKYIQTCTSITWLRPVLHAGTLLCINNTWLGLVFSHRQTSKPVRASPGLGQFCTQELWSVSIIPSWTR